MKASFFAKILLFGEYGIIKDAMGLSIPYPSYSGALRFSEGELNASEYASHASLVAYLGFLKDLSERGELIANLNLEQLETDIAKGLIFDSSIPQGYGVGSSGALVAAIYGQYAKGALNMGQAPQGSQLQQLKAELAQMESFFHGKSSGVDPVICYLQLPLLISDQQKLGTVDVPETNAQGEGAVFLLNSGGPSETQPMVSIFMNKLKEEGFRNVMSKQFKKYNDACIGAFLDGEWDPMFHNLKSLSRLALDHFQPMIPEHFVPAWEKGIESNAYYLKLCGSGGGGYILGFTRDMEQAKELLKPHNPEVVLRF